MTYNHTQILKKEKWQSHTVDYKEMTESQEEEVFRTTFEIAV